MANIQQINRNVVINNKLYFVSHRNSRFLYGYEYKEIQSFEYDESYTEEDEGNMTKFVEYTKPDSSAVYCLKDIRVKLISDLENYFVQDFSVHDNYLEHKIDSSSMYRAYNTPLYRCINKHTFNRTLEDAKRNLIYGYYRYIHANPKVYDEQYCEKVKQLSINYYREFDKVIRQYINDYDENNIYNYIVDTLFISNIHYEHLKTSCNEFFKMCQNELKQSIDKKQLKQKKQSIINKLLAEYLNNDDVELDEITQKVQELLESKKIYSISSSSESL
jgi:hypothetical protein